MADPLYQHIMIALQEEIRNGKFKPGDKLPSEAALVKRFRTSRITVGRALRELQTKGSIERRAGSGSYVSERDPASLPLSFGLLIPDLGETEIFDAICRNIANASEAADHVLIWGHEDEREISKEARCWSLCQQFIARKASGVFFAPLEFETGASKANIRILRALHDAGIPVVLLDRQAVPSPTHLRADLVGLNNPHAGYLATEHLIECGARRIGFIGYQAAESTLKARMTGYRDALRAHGLPELPLEPNEAAARFDEEADAFVCVNDKVAAAVMRAFLSRGVRIPEQLQLVGIDDVPYAQMLPVPLTTVQQPLREIGHAALRAMLDRVREPTLPPREILLSGELVIRQSSRTQTGEISSILEFRLPV
jgi:DNA-binding LacI/PurR family transcriptional regulator